MADLTLNSGFNSAWFYEANKNKMYFKIKLNFQFNEKKNIKVLVLINCYF